jgi:signal transduction histidine kinase
MDDVPNAEARRWRLLARLADVIGTSAHDYGAIAETSARILSEEVGDECTVLLLDLPEVDRYVYGQFHPRTEVRESALRVLNALGTEGVRELVSTFNNNNSRDARRHLPLAQTSHFVLALQEHNNWRQLVDSAAVPIRAAGGVARGIILIGRDERSQPFVDSDRHAVESAADTIALGLRTMASLAAEEDVRRRWVEAVDHRRVLLAGLISAEQHERERIAGEVHDDALQLLAAAQLRIEIMRRQIADAELEEMSETLSTFAELVTEAQRKLRNLLLDLEMPTAPDRPLHEALAQTADAFFYGSTATVAVEGTLSSVPSDVAAVFHRAGREALSNASRHSAATTVVVTLSEDVDGWVMSVDDDGVGLPELVPDRPGHLGVRGMRNRAVALGGTFTIGASPLGGARVELRVPRNAVQLSAR